MASNKTNTNNSPSKAPKFRTNYDTDFKGVVVKYAIQTSNKAASDHFGINESNVRRWKRLSLKAELLENTIARRTMTKKTKVRRKPPSRSKKKKKKQSSNVIVDQQESSDIDSMPLQQRLTAIASTSAAPEPEKPVPTLKSQPLSPTKLKVTRQSNSKPQQQPQQQPKPIEEKVQPPIREEVCLKWNTHHSNMQMAFPALLNKEQYCDVTLVADGTSLKCHKLILSSCSAYFDQVLEKVAPYQHPIIFMKDIPFNIMKALCDFMYIGEVNILQSDLDQILAVGESLKIKGLASKSDGNNTASKPSTCETPKPPSKPNKATSKPSVPEKNVSVDDTDITDPLDLMEPTYEEVATPDIPPPVLKRNDSTRKSTGRKVKKRKHVEVDHEPSPPVFRMRKGTRSRPNVKVPRYFNANFDNSVPAAEPAPSEFVEPNEPAEVYNDPFMNILDEIKTEPLDIEDSYEESYIDEMSHAEIDDYNLETTIEETTPKVLKKRRTSRAAVVAKLEKPDPLNVDHDALQRHAEEMELQNTERIEHQDENHPVEENVETSDRQELPIENSDHEEATSENIQELHVPLNEEVAMDVDNSEFEEEHIEETGLDNAEQLDRLPEIGDRNEAGIDKEETQVLNSDGQIVAVVSNTNESTAHISDSIIENSEVHIENSDGPLENSDDPLENSDDPLENSDIPMENSGKEEIKAARETLSGNIQQGESLTDIGEMDDVTTGDNMHVGHSDSDKNEGKSCDMAEMQSETIHAEKTVENCLKEGEKLKNDSERLSENSAVDSRGKERLNSIEGEAQVSRSEEEQPILTENSLNEVKVLSTTEEDPLK